MTQKEYLKIFAAECQEEVDLTTRKNADYASGNDAFKNFKAIEFLTDGKISLEEGIIVRITDKFQRAINLLSREAKVADEKITDTLRDISVYARILRIYLLHEKKQEAVLGRMPETREENYEETRNKLTYENGFTSKELKPVRLVADFKHGKTVMIGQHILAFDGIDWICKDCDNTLQSIIQGNL